MGGEVHPPPPLVAVPRRGYSHLPPGPEAALELGSLLGLLESPPRGLVELESVLGNTEFIH